MSSPSVIWKRLSKGLVLAISLMVFVLVLASCQNAEPAAAPTEAPTAAEVPTEQAVATQEPTAEPTAEPAQEAEATVEPAAEAEATAEPAEETAVTDAPVADAIANGQYVVNLTGGCGCHFNRDLGALAGGNAFERPSGVVYARNITPDPETGIGNWSPEDVAAALHLGVRPDGTQLHPTMPYMAFSALSDQEALDVAAYLFSLEPVVNEVPARELTSEPEPFTPASAPPAEPPSDPVARGEELVTITRCGSCHTPTNEDGSPNMEMFLAGGPIQNDEIAANITPDEETGIGAWSAAEIGHLLQTGERPDGSMVEGAMAQQIDRRFSKLTDDDALAIGEFLKSIPAVSNNPFQ